MHNANTFIIVALLIAITYSPFEIHCGFACLSNPCIHGVCLDDLNSTYSCYCIDGYTGVQCQTNWDECWSSPCQNGGVCHDGIATFNCSCPAGFVGDACEEDYNECESNPCMNNGTCMDWTNGYECNCLPGYAGTHCEIDVAVCNATNETRCQNGGICVEGPGVTFSCRCPPGWEGFLCDAEVDECRSSPCENGAVCVDLHADYACACLFGFTGRNCEEVVLMCDDNLCENSALCLMEDDHPVCYCVPDFHGERCQYQYDECQLGPRCMNGGTCIDGIDNFTCSCPPNLTGLLCECLIVDEHLLDCTYTTPTSNYHTTTETITTSTLSTLTTPTTTTTTSASELAGTTTTTTTTTSTTTEPITTNTAFITTIPTTMTTTTPTTTMIPTIVTEQQVPNYTLRTTSTSHFPTDIDTTTMTINEFTVTELFTTSTLSFIDLVTTTPTTTSTTSTAAGSTTETDLIPTTLTAITTTTTEQPSTIKRDDGDEITTMYPTPIDTSTPHGVTETLPSSTLPGSTLPGSTLPGSTLPGGTLPGSPLPSSTLPGSTLPGGTLPGSTVTLSPDITTTPTTTTTTKKTTIKMGRESNDTLPPDLDFTTLSTTHRLTEILTTDDLDYSTTELMNITTLLTTTTTLAGELTSLTTTTIDDDERPPTTLIAPASSDCSVEGNYCQNGGSCMFTTKGHKCICPFDTDGVLCEIQLGIKNAAFGGDAFLAHRLNHQRLLSIELNLKTTSMNGMIFTTNIDQTYMSLYTENGYLKFKFSCGYQTMLLSELGKPINDGYPIRINADLILSNDLKHCNASIKVNETLCMSGDQIARIDKFTLRQNSWLYLGGMPNIQQTGFVGCMSNLRILGKSVHIFKDAEDGFGVVECSSLACLSNPCRNGGACIARGEEWSCRCRNGYSGNVCDVSICANNPCQFGGTCLPYTGSGYICLCPIGKRGHFCENDLLISKPYFSSSIKGYSSFIAYPIPKGKFNRMEVKFRFTPTTMEQISLLMFIGQRGKHDFYSDHVAVSFVKGYIMLTWNLGSGPRRIFTSQPIIATKPSYTVQIGRFGRRSWLYVEDLGNVTGRSPGNLMQLDVDPLLYFGGYYVQNFTNLPHDLPLHTGFSGCIYDMELKLDNIVLPLIVSSQTIGRALGQCGTTECYENICHNNGACLYHGGTFTCLCKDDNYGPLCSSKYNHCDKFRNNCEAGSTCVSMIAGYECDCPIGKTGKYCEKDELLSDISFSGIRSYVTLPAQNLDFLKFNIEFELRPLKDSGLVLFIGKDEMFLSVSLLNGLLNLRILPGRKRQMNEVLIMNSNKLIILAMWHTIKISLYGRKIYLFVNNVVNTGTLQSGDVLNLYEDNIYLGGLPDLSALPISSSPSLSIPYVGCFRKLLINNRHVPLNNSTIRSSRNIGDCDGTPCGGDYCENNGICWLDPNLKPHCSCKDPFYGERCEITPKCDEKQCKNRGRCLNGKCVCLVGFRGAFCEAAIVVTAPKFEGRSYLFINNKVYKKRHVNDLNAISVNFTTAAKNGLLIWIEKDLNHLIALGLEKGRLKLLLKSGENKTIEMPNQHYIADGFNHSLKLSLKPFTLELDERIVDLLSNRTLWHYAHDGLYLGGVPSHSPSAKEAFKYFHNNFDGCVYNFSANNEIVNEYNEFEGENIDVCSV